MTGARLRPSARTGLEQAVITTSIGLVYWSIFSWVVATNEPWDRPYYWSVAYPGSIVIAFALGVVFQRRAGITSAALTFTQFPIMVANTGLGPLALVGVMFLGLLSVPVMLAAGLPMMRR